MSAEHPISGSHPPQEELPPNKLKMTWFGVSLFYLSAMHRAVSALVYTLVFATGAAGLIYQVVWQRYLARLLGSDSTAIAIILAVFLGGLSLGYWICGRWTKRLENFLRGYALLEFLIGLWALLFPMLYRVVEAATHSWNFAPATTLLFQGIFCALVLMLVPTICMGGTIPLLTRGLSATLADATRTHALIYGINTAGAFAGALLAGFFLIAALGLPATLKIAATVNFCAALVFALFPFRQRAANAPVSTAEEIPSPKTNGRWRLYAIAFLSGAYVMMLENVLIRVTNLSFGSSSYSFSLIVAVFVLCIALGSLGVGKRKNISAETLFWNQSGIAASLFLLFLLLDKGPYFAHLIRICFQPNVAGFWFYHAMTLGALLLVLLVPVSLAGATLPLLFHELKRDLPNVGSQAGALFSLNALGCVAGSLCGGVLLYLVFNIDGIFLCAVVLAAISAVLASLQLSRRHWLVSVGLILSGLIFVLWRPFFQKERFAFGTFRLMSATPFSFEGSAIFYKEFLKNHHLKFYKDGAAGTVAVIEKALKPAPSPTDLPFSPPEFAPPIVTTNAPERAIVVNGKSDSDVVVDRETLKLTAHIPALWAEKRAKAMIIGLGTGVTAGELALYPELQSIDVAEISPEVFAALPLFGESTRNVHKDPRLHVHIGDAFRIIGRSKEKWDMIISEPSNPWVTGVDQLFSREYYRLVREHLAEGGVFVQWVQQYAFNTEAFSIVGSTVKSEFKNFALFQGTKGDLIILARNEPFTRADRQRAERVFSQNNAAQKSLMELEISSVQDLLKRERPALANIAANSGQFGVETLDRPRLHFLAGKTFFTGEELGKEPISSFSGSSAVISEKALEFNPIAVPENNHRVPRK